MGLSIDGILTLVGRLDDEAGYDAPRERFRQFLLDHVTSAIRARPLIDSCLASPGEQHGRALQDLVVRLGHFLGFDLAFGAYAPLAGAVRYDGLWQSKARVHLVLEVRHDTVLPGGLESLTRSMAAAAATAADPRVRVGGLVVVAAPHADRSRVDESAAALRPAHRVDVVWLESLLSLAELGEAGHLGHDDIVRLIQSDLGTDYLVRVLRRQVDAPAAPAALAPREPREEAVTPAASGPPLDGTSAAPREPERVGSVLAESSGPSYWIAPIGHDHAESPEAFLEHVVLGRRVFGVAGDWSGPDAAAPGDRLCFYVSGKGVVGEARVAALAATGAIRDAHRFRQLLHLDDVQLRLESPIAIDGATRLELFAGLNRRVPVLVRLTRDRFLALTAPHDPRPGAGAEPAARPAGARAPLRVVPRGGDGGLRGAATPPSETAARSESAGRTSRAPRP